MITVVIISTSDYQDLGLRRVHVIGMAMVVVLDLQSRGCMFDLEPFYCQVTTLGKLFRHVPMSPGRVTWHWSNGGKVTGNR